MVRQAGICSAHFWKGGQVCGKPDDADDDIMTHDHAWWEPLHSMAAKVAEVGTPCAWKRFALEVLQHRKRSMQIACKRLHSKIEECDALMECVNSSSYATPKTEQRVMFGL